MSKLLNSIYLVIIRDTAKVARVPSTSCRGKDPVKRGIIFCLWSLNIYYFCKLFAISTISFSKYSVISTTY